MIKHALGVKLLAVYLILVGIVLLLGLTIPYGSIIQGLLALVAGILLLVGR